MAAGIRWTRGVLDQADTLDTLAALPAELRLQLRDGTTVVGVHASPGSDNDPGSMIAQHYRRPRHQEFVRFLRRIDARMPFCFAQRAAAPAPLRLLTEPGTLGFSEPNEAGRQYRHGTLSAYNAGRCRCEHCRRAFADYRAGRRAAHGTSSRPRRAIDEDKCIGRNWFRRMVWRPARQAAGLTDIPRFHDLRQSHASWLLAGGGDLQVVKERLGHASIMTTQRYLHTLPEPTRPLSRPLAGSATEAPKPTATPRRSA